MSFSTTIKLYTIKLFALDQSQASLVTLRSIKLFKIFVSKLIL